MSYLEQVKAFVAEKKLAAYQQAEETVSTLGRRVTLVGHSRKPASRPCPHCRKSISPGDTVINYGQINNRWVWICLGCAPEDPWHTPHLKGVGPVCPSCNRPLSGEEEHSADCCSGCREKLKGVDLYLPFGTPDGLHSEQWYPIQRMKRSLPFLECFICGGSSVWFLGVTETQWEDHDPDAMEEGDPPCHKLRFRCSSGHVFSICFGTHVPASEHAYYPFPDPEANWDEESEGPTVVWWHPGDQVSAEEE